MAPAYTQNNEETLAEESDKLEVKVWWFIMLGGIVLGMCFIVLVCYCYKKRGCGKGGHTYRKCKLHSKRGSGIVKTESMIGDDALNVY